MIKLADDTMSGALRTIWRECFGDSESYIDMYFDGRHKSGECLVYIENGVVCAMLVIYKGFLLLGGVHTDAYYIYGVSTLPEYRGRGISTRLLEHARRIIAKRGGISVLAPAGEELIGFYKKRGYTEAFCIKQAEWEVEDVGCDTEIFSIAADEYKKLRDRRFSKDGYFVWGAEMLEYAISENCFLGGKSCRLSAANDDYAVMYYVNGDTLYVQETTIGDDVLKSALNSLAVQENCKKVSVRLAPDSIVDGNIRTLAMADADICKNGYMNIVFD